MLPFVTQYQLLVSTIKEALMEKRNPPPPPPKKRTTTSYFATYLKNHLLFPTRKEKSWQTCLLEPKYEINYQSNDASVLHVL